MPLASANAITLEYETAGNSDAPPILLIMGLGMQLTWWPASSGTTDLHGLVMFVVDATRPFSSPATFP